MRWKIIFVTILFLVLLIVGGVGWMQWKSSQKGKSIDQKIALCRNQMEMGRHAEAQGNLEKLLADNPRLSNADDLYALLAESYSSTNAQDKANSCWDKIRTAFPTSKHMDKALAISAAQLYATGKPKEAAAVWDTILANYKTSPLADEALAGKAQLLYDEGELVGARDALKKALTDSPNSPTKGKLQALLGKINLELLYSGAPETTDIYTIARGDKLETIGRRFKVSPDLLKRVNHIRVTSMPIGKRLKIPKTKFSILVNKSDNTLTLMNNGEFFKIYSVRTGKEEYMTPTGEFRVESKVVNPPWNNPETGEKIPPADPRNELGSRWMAFQGSIGIHGTIHPETVGKYASNGCVGMLGAEVEELYDLVPLYSPIKIIGTQTKTGKMRPASSPTAETVRKTEGNAKKP